MRKTEILRFPQESHSTGLISFPNSISPPKAQEEKESEEKISLTVKLLISAPLLRQF